MLKRTNNNRIFKYAAGIIIFTFIAAAFLFCANYQPAQAQSSNNMLWGGQSGQFQANSGLGSGDPRIIVARIIQIFLGFLGIVFICLIMWGGWIWTTSAGEENNIDRAKKIITNAVIGLVIILMSFAIATFILNRFLATTAGGGGTTTDTPGAGMGLGALGGCSVSMVYPEPDQAEVPRNTSIVITFKEAINPATFYDSDKKIIPENVHIWQTKSGDGCPGDCSKNITGVLVNSTDNKTFVLTPINYLGSPSEYIWHTVHLTNDILKPDGKGIFSTCRSDYLEWQFEVSNKIDLTPPQVLSNGVFPRPDNLPDEAKTTVADAAIGKITVKDRSKIKVDVAAAADTPGPIGASPAANATIDPDNAQNGALLLAIESDGKTASLKNVTNSIMLGAALFEGDTVAFPDILILKITGAYSAGNSWNIDVAPAVKADTLTVGNTVYKFVSGSAGANEIAVGSDENATAANIKAALTGNPDVSAAAAINSPDVNLAAKISGASGNNINLITSNTDALTISAMRDGKDENKTVTQKGAERDEARNAVIQINFNEAINPTTVSGSAGDVKSYIKVVNNKAGAKSASSPDPSCVNDEDCLSYKCAANKCVNDYLDGKFMIANGYRTVEFISDNQCGVNGCGEKIYCLPPLSNLRVDLAAGNLEGCINCETKTPFTSCPGGHCYDSAKSENYPKAEAFSGIADMALNSLDGNRNNKAEGQISFYDQNTPAATDGDNFRWSFWISSILDLTPPKINGTVPAHIPGGAVSLSAPILVKFSKLMMSSGLGTGSIKINNGKEDIEHKLINLWNRGGQATGYWTVSENVDVPPPLDGKPDQTEAQIKHSLLSDSSSYRAQVGSGVKDIYQNCFKPSAGAGCNATELLPSCCVINNVLTPYDKGSCP